MPNGVVGAAPFEPLFRVPAARRSVRIGSALRHIVCSALLLGSAAVMPAWAQPAVNWELQVMERGVMVDDFHHTTTLGQARTVEASHASRHAIACPPPGGTIPASSATPLTFDLTRTITLSPIHLDANQITLALDTREMVEDDATPDPRIDCATLPEPRVVTLHHPGLVVQTGNWTTLTIIEHDPSLSYRIKAEMSQP